MIAYFPCPIKPFSEVNQERLTVLLSRQVILASLLDPFITSAVSLAAGISILQMEDAIEEQMLAESGFQKW